MRSTRASWRIVRLLTHILYGMAVIRLTFHKISPEEQRAVKQRWALDLVTQLGVSVHCDQPLPEKASLIVANHISWLDIFVINAHTQTHFVCKDDVQSWPMLGWLVEHSGTVFIARGNRAAAARTAQALMERLERNERVAVFPEGTTTNGTFMLPFRPALLQAAVDGNATVTPIALRYTDAQGKQSFAPAYDGDITMWQCMWAIATSEGLQAHLQVLESIAPSQEDDSVGRREISQIAYQRLADALGFESQNTPLETKEAKDETLSFSH